MYQIGKQSTSHNGLKVQALYYIYSWSYKNRLRQSLIKALNLELQTINEPQTSTNRKTIGQRLEVWTMIVIQTETNRKYKFRTRSLDNKFKLFLAQDGTQFTLHLNVVHALLQTNAYKFHTTRCVFIHPVTPTITKQLQLIRIIKL